MPKIGLSKKQLFLISSCCQKLSVLYNPGRMVGCNWSIKKSHSTRKNG